MKNFRVIIADMDINYIIPLQLRFIEEYTYEIDLEVITERDYFEQFFQTPQNLDVLVVSEKMYSEKLQKHEIGHIYVLSENLEKNEKLGHLPIERIFKYTSVKAVFHQITSTCFGSQLEFADKVKSAKVITVCSGKGGVGKTAVSLGIAGDLAANYKKVLYLNVAELQDFQAYMENAQLITDSQIYSRLNIVDASIYQKLKCVLRKEQFYYLPPFRAPLFSFGVKISLYLSVIKAAKESMEYDYIIVDLNVGINNEFMSFIDISDKVIILTEQGRGSVVATERLVKNISGIHSGKYLFVCNKYDQNRKNELIKRRSELSFCVETYIEYVQNSEDLQATDLAGIKGMSKVAYHIM